MHCEPLQQCRWSRCSAAERLTERADKPSGAGASFSADHSRARSHSGICLAMLCARPQRCQTHRVRAPAQRRGCRPCGCPQASLYASGARARRRYHRQAAPRALACASSLSLTVCAALAKNTVLNCLLAVPVCYMCSAAQANYSVHIFPVCRVNFKHCKPIRVRKWLSLKNAPQALYHLF